MNLVMLLGNLGTDVETRYTNNGTPVATFSMATTDQWKDDQGQKQESTEWHNIKVWGALATACANNLRKGSKVLVSQGKNRTESWDDEAAGVKRYKTYVEVREIKFLDGKPKENGQTPPPPAPPTTAPVPPPPAPPIANVPPPPPPKPAGPTYEQLIKAGWVPEQIKADPRFANLTPAQTYPNETGL